MLLNSIVNRIKRTLAAFSGKDLEPNLKGAERWGIVKGQSPRIPHILGLIQPTPVLFENPLLYDFLSFILFHRFRLALGHFETSSIFFLFPQVPP